MNQESIENIDPDESVSIETRLEMDSGDLRIVERDEIVEENIEFQEVGNAKEEIPVPEFTVNEIIDKLGFGLFHIYLTLYAGSYFMMEAAEVNMMSLLLPFLKEKMNLSTLQESLCGAIVFTGMAIGSYSFGYLSDKKGRRFAIACSVIIASLSGVISAFCLNFWLFMIVRFFVGFAMGGAPVSYSLYIEYLPTRLRGVLVLNINLFWGFGAIYESIIGWIILSNDEYLNGRGWNWYVFCSSLPLVINLLLLPFTPESVRYLSMSKNANEEELKKIFKFISRLNCRKLPEHYRIRMKQSTSKRRGKITDLFRKETFFMFFCICVFFMAGSFVYYGVALSTPELIRSNESYSIYLGTLLLSLSEIIGLIVPSFIFCCLSRNHTQGLAFCITGLSLLMLIIPVDKFGYKLLFGLLARMGVMAASCIMWVISTESLPTSIRSLGSGIGNGLGKLCTIIAPFGAFLFGNVGNNNIIAKLLFASASLFACVVSLLYPYEARGKGLVDTREEVELKDMTFIKKITSKNKEKKKKEEKEDEKNQEIGEVEDDRERSL